MTMQRLNAEMMERAIRAANARTSPNIIMPDGREIPLLLYAMRQLMDDIMDAQAQAMGLRNAFCENFKVDPNNHRMTWDENWDKPPIAPETEPAAQ